MQTISRIVFLLLMGLSGLVVVPAYAAQDDNQEAVSDAQGPVTDPDYRIGAEDVLEISVWKEDGLKKESLVRPDGGLSFPLIGEVRAAGKTAQQLKEEIAKLLEKYIPEPVVSVSVLKVASNKIYVIGKVNKPGEFVSGRYIDVLQALSMAGGLTPFASENHIKILRRENGKNLVIPFQYSKVEKGEKLDQNILLQSGDTVVVP